MFCQNIFFVNIFMEIISYLFQVFKAYLYKGVDPMIPGNGGKECKNYLSMNRRLLETLLIVTISLIEVGYSSKNIRQKHKKVEKHLSILEKHCSQTTIK